MFRRLLLQYVVGVIRERCMRSVTWMVNMRYASELWTSLDVMQSVSCILKSVCSLQSPCNLVWSCLWPALHTVLACSACMHAIYLSMSRVWRLLFLSRSFICICSIGASATIAGTSAFHINRCMYVVIITTCMMHVVQTADWQFSSFCQCTLLH